MTGVAGGAAVFVYESVIYLTPRGMTYLVHLEWLSSGGLIKLGCFVRNSLSLLDGLFILGRDCSVLLLVLGSNKGDESSR